LPKFATQSPRDMLLCDGSESREAHATARARGTNIENICGTGISCNIDNRGRRVFGHYSHRFEQLSSHRHRARCARADIGASTLP
jgi:hypothetical protein